MSEMKLKHLEQHAAIEKDHLAQCMVLLQLIAHLEKEARTLSQRLADADKIILQYALRRVNKGTDNGRRSQETSG